MVVSHDWEYRGFADHLGFVNIQAPELDAFFVIMCRV